MKTINKIRVNNFEGMIEMTEKGETLIKKNPENSRRKRTINWRSAYDLHT